MSNADWQRYIDQCTAQELPCIPMGDREPWFSAEFIARNYLLIEKVPAFIREWKDAPLPMIRIKRHPLIRFSDVERFGQTDSGTVNPIASEPANQVRRDRRRTAVTETQYRGESAGMVGTSRRRKLVSDRATTESRIGN